MAKERKSHDWKELVPGCFAAMPLPFTAPFAAHPRDNKRALMMLFSALIQGASKPEIMEEIERCLYEFGYDRKGARPQLKRVRAFIQEHTKPVRKKSAWLVTWEGTDIEDWPQERKIVSILDGRKSPEFIRDYVHEYYIASEYSLTEKLRFSSQPKKALNPYPAEFDRIDGALFLGRITCGHNPFLLARKVTNLRIFSSGDHIAVQWQERPKPTWD